MQKKKAIILSKYTLYIYEDKREYEDKIMLMLFNQLFWLRQKNNHQYQLSLLSRKMVHVKEEIANLQNAKSQAKDLWTTISQPMNQLPAMIAQQGMSTYQADSGKIDAQIQQAMKSNDSNAVAELNKQKVEMNQKYANSLQESMIKYQAGMGAVAGINSMVNSVFDHGDDAEIARLQALSTSYENEKDLLDNELTSDNANYEAAKKAAGEEAKQEAPTFGLS